MKGEAINRELSVMSRLVRLLRGYKWLIPLVVVLGLLASLLEGASLSLLIPLLSALTDSGGTQVRGSFLASVFRNANHLIPLNYRIPAVALAIFGAVCLKSLVNYANTAAFFYVDARVTHDLRTRLFARMLSVPLAEAEDSSSGALINLLEIETWRTSQALGVVFNAITSACTAAIFVPLLFLLSWRLALLSMLCVVVVLATVSLVTREVRSLGDRAVVASTELSVRTWSSLSGLRVIHNFGRETFELGRYTKSSNAARDVLFRLSLISARHSPVSEILITAIMAALAFLVPARLIDMATLAAFVLILYRLQPRVRDLMSSRVSLVGYEGAILAVTDFLEKDAAPASPASEFPESWSVIRFKDVTFRHNKQEVPALDNVSFEIRRGSTVAIIGSSGAGKSTLLDLLLGYRDPQAGRVTVDGAAIQEFGGDAWRSKIAVVNQDPYVFDETIRYNIQYGRSEADDAEVMAAATLACADPFIRELPNGYETLVGERGVRLSGGQRQRLVLARALVRKPEILILDEATNALDSVTEETFHQALAQFSTDRTVIIVAHRLSTVQQAEHILVLHEGKLIEEGNFSSLLARNGLFTRMYELQSFGHATEFGEVATD